MSANQPHPEWCSQGPQCWPPSAGGGTEGDRIVEWVHCSAAYVEHIDGVAQVAFERFDPASHPRATASPRTEAGALGRCSGREAVREARHPGGISP